MNHSLARSLWHFLQHQGAAVGQVKAQTAGRLIVLSGWQGDMLLGVVDPLVAAELGVIGV